MILDKQVFHTEQEFNAWAIKNYPARYQELLYPPDKQDYPVYFRGYYISEYADHEQIWLVWFPIKEIGEYLGD